MLTDPQIERYARHILLREVGGVGQERLLAGEVAISPLPAAAGWAALYLAAAGVGRLVLRDPSPVGVADCWPALGVASLGASREEALLVALPAFNDGVAVSVGPGSSDALRIDCGLGREAFAAAVGPRLLVHAQGEHAAVCWLGPHDPCGPCVRAALPGSGEAAPWAAAAAGALAAVEALRHLAGIGVRSVGLQLFAGAGEAAPVLDEIRCEHRARGVGDGPGAPHGPGRAAS